MPGSQTEELCHRQMGSHCGCALTPETGQRCKEDSDLPPQTFLPPICAALSNVSLPFARNQLQHQRNLDIMLLLRQSLQLQGCKSSPLERSPDSAQQTDRFHVSPTLHQHDRDCDFFAKMLPPMGGLSATLTSRLRSFRGKVMHQIAMSSVNFLQKQVNRGI